VCVCESVWGNIHKCIFVYICVCVRVSMFLCVCVCVWVCARAIVLVCICFSVCMCFTTVIWFLFVCGGIHQPFVRACAFLRPWHSMKQQAWTRMSQTHMSRLNSLTGTSSSSRRERVRAWKSAVDSVSLRYVNDATIPSATPIDACCLLDVRCTQNSLDTHMLFRHFVHTFA